MKLVTLVKKTLPYIKPYAWKIAATMVLTVIGAFIAQINAIVLDGTVDAISNHVIGESVSWHRIVVILGIISAVLLIKEVLWSLITYHQHYFGMKIRIDVSRDLSQAAVDHLLHFRKSFFLDPNNETGKIHTRVDQGVSNLSFTIQNFFTVWAGVPSSQRGLTSLSVSHTPFSIISRQFCINNSSALLILSSPFSRILHGYGDVPV